MCGRVPKSVKTCRDDFALWLLPFSFSLAVSGRRLHWIFCWCSPWVVYSFSRFCVQFRRGALLWPRVLSNSRSLPGGFIVKLSTTKFALSVPNLWWIAIRVFHFISILSLSIYFSLSLSLFLSLSLPLYFSLSPSHQKLGHMRAGRHNVVRKSPHMWRKWPDFRAEVNKQAKSCNVSGCHGFPVPKVKPRYLAWMCPLFLPNHKDQGKTEKTPK